MKIVKTQVARLLICRLEGRLDAHQVPRLKSELEPPQGSLHLDFTEVTFIDSSGLAAIVSLYKKVREAGFTFEISGVQDAVRLILELTGLDTILPIRAVPVLEQTGHTEKNVDTSNAAPSLPERAELGRT